MSDAWKLIFMQTWGEGFNYQNSAVISIKRLQPISFHIVIILFLQALSQFSSRKNLFGNRHEVFFLNLEDGYFGCQVNESVEFLQVYELSRLCDGLQDCYMGSDELRKELKCTSE